MPEYGLTPKGPNIKRMDVILDEMHGSLSQKVGVNTRQSPESLLNHMLTNIADRIAELWELGADIYYSQYPSTAEGISLDNAAQYGGSTREAAARSYYPIHCTGRDGTVLEAGSLISAELNPTVQLSLPESREITRGAFNRAAVKTASLEANSVYTAAINGSVYSFTPAQAEPLEILSGLASVITEKGFGVSVDEEAGLLVIEAEDPLSSNTLVLSENLTTETVTSVITFGTVEIGDILIPEGVITNIVKADPGLLKVVNRCGYIAGRETESDSEFRRSYADKIFVRSSMMLESIRSSILQNVQGVTSVAPYENPTHEWDEYGRPPHSVEIVVDGGDPVEIAKRILDKKAGGINTYGDTTVIVPGKYDEDIPIRFSRPAAVYVWFRLGITLSKNEGIPPNYVELLRKVVLENMDVLEAGADVVPQQFISQLYRVCSGISYVDISVYAAADEAEQPDGYPDRSVGITARQRAYTSEDMIEVVIDG